MINIQNIKHLGRFSTFLVLFIALILSGCVNRIDIPEDEDSVLVINLEMLKGQTRYTADFKTSNNLNGTFPISSPNDAVIKIIDPNPNEADVDPVIELIFDEESGMYVSDQQSNQTFLRLGRTYELEASIEGSNFERISATTTVPYELKINALELLSEETIMDKEGNEFWQGIIGVEFIPSVNKNTKYGHLHLTEMKTFIMQEPGQDPTYPMEGDSEYFQLINVNIGSLAITDIAHRDGFFIDFDNLDNAYAEFVIRSPFPITEPNQVTAVIRANLTAVSVDHYNYHLALHNIREGEENIFQENALYRSNIEKGFGLFSTCHESISTHLIR
ncbi:MAG: DUF4249 family protein [Bacteroidota bacterium]